METTRQHIQHCYQGFFSLISVSLLLTSITRADIAFNTPEAVDDELNRSKDFLEPNSGTYFKHLKKIVTNRDEILLTIAVPLPDFSSLLTLLAQDKFVQLKDKCFTIHPASYHDIRDIVDASCNVYKNINRMFNQTLHRTRILAADKLDILKDYIPTLTTEIEQLIPQLLQDTEHPRSRHYEKYPGNLKGRKKRFIAVASILSLAMTGIKSGISMYKTHQLRNRINAIKQDVSTLYNNDYKLAKTMMKFQTSLTALAVSTESEVSRLNHRLNATNQRISDLTEAVGHNMQDIANLNRSLKIQAYSTTAQINQLLILNNLKDLTAQSINMLSTLVTAFHTLQLGKLPRKLIPMKQLNQLLTELAYQLQFDIPDYQIASTITADYYKMDSIIWGISGNNFIINIPIIITEKSTTPFELFEIQTFYVPTDIHQSNTERNNQQPASYTKILADYQYIAFTQDVYVLISESMLRECTEIQGTLFCRDLVIHTHRQNPSCFSIIYWKEDISLINEHCVIKYFHNIVPTPSVYEDATHIMLVNVHHEWRIICKNKQFPQPVKGTSYAMIEKKPLCACEILIGQAYFIPKTRMGCTNIEYNLNIKYPINSLILYNLRDMLHNITQNFQYYEIPTSDQTYSIPNLKVSQLLDDTKVLYELPQTGIPLDKVIHLIQSDETAFLTANDLIVSESQIKHWFDNDSIENTVIFIMGLISLISFATLIGILIHYCKRNGYIAATLTSLAAQIGMTQAVTNYHQPNDITKDCITRIVKFFYLLSFNINNILAGTTNPEADTDKHNPMFVEIKFRFILVFIMTISIIVAAISKYIYKKYLQYRVFLPKLASNARNYQCHLYIEIINDKEKELIYLVSIGTTLINVTFNPRTRLDVISLTKNLLHGQLHVQWKRGTYYVFQTLYMYPTTLFIPFTKLFKVARMMRRQTSARLLILEDVFLLTRRAND